jgi:hypothetical protein
VKNKNKSSGQELSRAQAAGTGFRPENGKLAAENETKRAEQRREMDARKSRDEVRTGDSNALEGQESTLEKWLRRKNSTRQG